MVALQTELNDRLTSLVVRKVRLVIEKSVQPEDSQWQSHFGGNPYFEVGEQWPVNTQTGKPLEFIFQLVNDGTLPLPPEIGVFQFYHDYHGDEFIAVDTQTEGFVVKIYARADDQKQTIVQRPSELPSIDYYNIGFRYERSLPDWDELIDSNIKYLCTTLSPKNPWRIYQEKVAEILGRKEAEMGSWVGGYPHWLQGANGRGEFLMQLDSEGGFMWGDSGLLYFHYEAGNPKKIGFELQCC